MTTKITTQSTDIDCQQLLAVCPSKPNCVSSLADKNNHCYIDPLSLGEHPEHAWQLLQELLASFQGILIVSQQTNYIHVECQSRLLRFIDDLEFCWHPLEKICHVRSASRVGYYDFGVNRKRVEKIRRELFQQINVEL